MKPPANERELMERMAPGALCQAGCLGSDVRGLGEIIEADSAALARQGVDGGELGRRLEGILRAAEAGLGRPVQVAEGLTAVHREAMGRIACPWRGCGVFPKGQVELDDARTGRRFLLTPLSVHMILCHGFYQGRGSPYRLEPLELAEALGLTVTGGGQ